MAIIIIIIIKMYAVLALGVIDSGHLFSFNMDLYNISGVGKPCYFIFTLEQAGGFVNSTMFLLSVGQFSKRRQR